MLGVLSVCEDPRVDGLIQRHPHSNTDTLTADGQRVALFYTKLHNRLLRPLIAADAQPAPLELRQALKTIDRYINSYISEARVESAASYRTGYDPLIRVRPHP